MRSRIVAAALLAALPYVSLGAQRAGSPRLEVTLPPPAALTSEGPAVRAVDVISERSIRELLENGFPARLHFRVELWSAGGWFDDLRRAVEWDVVVRRDALSQKYRVLRIINNAVISAGQFAEIADAAAEAERPLKAPITANPQSGRQYYTAALEVEMLSINDLDELERWLRGELRPAVRGERNPGTAIGRGLKTVVLRLMGSERRNLVVRSGTFRVRE